MAIKVIKQGVLPPNPVMRGTCPICGCVVECLLQDTKSWIDGKAVDCQTPNCCGVIVVEVHAVPFLGGLLTRSGGEQ